MLQRAEKEKKPSLTFSYTFTDAVGLLQEVVVVALAAAVQEVFALARALVVVPARERPFTGSDDRRRSAGVYRTRGNQTLLT